MRVFRSLSEALHQGYEVVAAEEYGYLVRLQQADGSETFALVELAS